MTADKSWLRTETLDPAGIAAISLRDFRVRVALAQLRPYINFTTGVTRSPLDSRLWKFRLALKKTSNGYMKKAVMWDAPNETVWNTLLHTFRSSRRSKYREEAGLMGPTPNIGERCLWSSLSCGEERSFETGTLVLRLGKSASRTRNKLARTIPTLRSLALILPSHVRGTNANTVRPSASQQSLHSPQPDRYRR